MVQSSRTLFLLNSSWYTCKGMVAQGGNSTFASWPVGYVERGKIIQSAIQYEIACYYLVSSANLLGGDTLLE